MKVLLAGGGTGGHINPALAIASIIKQHDPSAEFLFVGTPNGMEARLVPAAGYALETMHVAGFQRKLNWKNIKRNCRAAYYLATSQHRAKQILKQFQPDIAIGTGGYVAGPILHAAAHMGIPCAIHEQNAFPGVTNKMLAKEVDHVMLTVEKALELSPPRTVPIPSPDSRCVAASPAWTEPQPGKSWALMTECASCPSAAVWVQAASMRQWQR